METLCDYCGEKKANVSCDVCGANVCSDCKLSHGCKACGGGEMTFE